MAFNSKSEVSITRGGVDVPGSPFSCRVYFPSARETKRAEVIPPVSRVARPVALSIANRQADVHVGDIAKLPDGSYRKVVDVRKYRMVVQCDLQWIPYQELRHWSAPQMSQFTDSTGNVLDASYSSPVTILAYLEPTDSSQMTTTMGNQDIRSAQVYSAVALKSNDAIEDGDGAIWLAVASSEHYAVTNDYVTSVRLEKAGLSGVV